ncbi:hypothetical protein QYF61_026035 [Mycteria americana]|uniref:Endonuclease/exonuclease/phosphatase domain-containing protein n=1 Tax=Mycteria americana TaxID=33587 RepID=A0AAN7N391_MYCAM|nr:hypothetical protein QYF61_026035 [Mycteria americana]
MSLISSLVLVTNRSSIASPLVGLSITWLKKLSSMHSWITYSSLCYFSSRCQELWDFETTGYQITKDDSNAEEPRHGPDMSITESREGSGEGSQVSRRAPEEQHKRIPANPASKSASSGAQLKCLYVNAHSTGNKQEELEMCARLEGHDLIGITEMRLDGSYDWSVGMEGYRLFWKGRQGRQRVALYVNDHLECVELHLGMDQETTKSLWVRIKERAGTGDIIVGVCHSPLDQENRADEALYRHIGAASRSEALVLMGDFNHPGICWRDNTAGHNQFGRFLECVDDNFLLQVTEEPTRRDAMLDLVLTNNEELVGNVKLKGILAAATMKWWS